MLGLRKTRFSLEDFLTEGGSQSVPVDLFCPKCGEAVSDKGQCHLKLAIVPDDPDKPDEATKTGFTAQLLVDCRVCHNFGRPPAVNKTF